MAYTSIRPGQVWLDTAGNRIHAHGGAIITEGDTFYWYGGYKYRSAPDSDTWHWGVRCYASKDLYNWENKGSVVFSDPKNPNAPLHPLDPKGPRIIYNPRTGKYVCWYCHCEDIRTHAFALTVLTADKLLGPYTVVRKGLFPMGMYAGSLVPAADPQDGKGYLYFERAHSELICADLTEDYTGVTGYYSTHFPRGCPPFVREAPAYFCRQGKHYLLTSGTTAWFPNPSEVVVADTYHGPWTVLGDPHRNDPSRTSFNSQIHFVFRHPAKRDLYIARADRYLPHLPESDPEAFYSGKTYAFIEDCYYRTFSGRAFDDTEQLRGLDGNVGIDSDYVWLPMRFDGDRPCIEWCDEWRVEDFD